MAGTRGGCLSVNGVPVMAGINGGMVGWCEAIEWLVSEHSNLVFHPVLNRQPVQLFQDMGVMCVDLAAPLTTRTAEFCTFWSL